MPINLLPASAAAFAPRATPNIVLNTKVDPWLTATLKRINRIKRPLNSVPQHFRCLTETLSSQSAIWTLCSIMLSKAPDSELRKDSNPLVEALFNYQLLYIEAYVVHVDMVSQNEVAFKLTPDTIESLVKYHKEIHSVDTAAGTWNWSEKEVQLKKLQEDFVQAANRFVYRTNATALEGLEEDGAGELLSGRSDEVKAAIMGLFLPLLPPPPRIVDVVRPIPLLPSSTGAENWWHPTLPLPSQAQMDPWKVVPSSPSNTSSGDSNSNIWATSSSTSSRDSDSSLWATSSNSSSGDSNSNIWATLGINELQLPSPTPSFCQPYSSSAQSSPQYYIAPMSSAPIPQLPLPSIIMQQQCSTSAGYGGGFGWENYQTFALPYGNVI